MCLQVAPLDRHSGVLRELAHGWAALPGSAAFLRNDWLHIDPRADRATWSVRWLIRVKRRTELDQGDDRARRASWNGAATLARGIQSKGERRRLASKAGRALSPPIAGRKRLGFGPNLLQHPEGACVGLILTLPAFSRLTSA